MYSQKGGSYRLVMSDVITGDTFTIPKGMKVTSVVSKVVANQSGNLAIGYGGSGEHLVAAVAVAADSVVTDHTLVALSTYTFSFTADKVMTVTLPTDCIVDLYVTMQKIN